jgi:mRNA-degrading endonuclease RelE of RelBE toxin-antitoxin system
MIRYRIEMPRAIRDLIRHLPPDLKRKIKVGLRSVAEDPYRAKELKDELAGLRSLKVAKARIIYRIKALTVEVVAFGPRADIYQRAAAELSRAARQTRGPGNTEKLKGHAKVGARRYA